MGVTAYIDSTPGVSLGGSSIPGANNLAVEAGLTGLTATAFVDEAGMIWVSSVKEVAELKKRGDLEFVTTRMGKGGVKEYGFKLKKVPAAAVAQVLDNISSSAGASVTAAAMALAGGAAATQAPAAAVSTQGAAVGGATAVGTSSVAQPAATPAMPSAAAQSATTTAAISPEERAKKENRSWFVVAAALGAVVAIGTWLFTGSSKKAKA